MSSSLFHHGYLSLSLSLTLPRFYLYFQFSHRTSIDTWHSPRARKKKNHLRKDPPLFPFSFFLPTSLRPSERPDQIWRRWNLSSIADNSRHGRRDYDRWAGRNSRPLWSAALGLECWVKKKRDEEKTLFHPPPPHRLILDTGGRSSRSSEDIDLFLLFLSVAIYVHRFRTIFRWWQLNGEETIFLDVALIVSERFFQLLIRKI